MSLLRPHLFSVTLAALLLAVLPSFAQQGLPMPPQPSTEIAKPSANRSKAINVPMLDEPPSLTLPLPNVKPSEPAKEADKAPAKPNTLETAPLPELRAVPPTVATPNPNATGSSTSELGQFVIHGADLESRTFINKICEETAEQLSLLLHDTARFEIPIVVSVKTPPNVSPTGAAVTTDFAQLAFGGFRLQITIQVRPDFNVGDFREELVRMLLAERILRGHKELTSTRDQTLPDWLLVGVKEAMRYRSRSRPSAIFAAIFRTGKVYGIEEILGTSPGSLDALSRTLYETSCCALVLALIDQPEGNLRMAKFLSALCTESKSDREMLNKWFPGMNASKSSLNKWWSLQMANLATPSVFETLGPSETAKELDQALMIHYETTPADVPAPKLASAEDETLKAEAETEAKKRGFFGRLFASDKSGKSEKLAADAPLPVELKAANIAAPDPVAIKTEKAKAEKPKPAPKKKEVAAAPEEPLPEDKPVEEKSRFRLRKMFGFGSGSSTSVAEDLPPKVEAKKEDKSKPESKKDEKPKVEPKKEDKPKPELKKEEKPKVDSKKEDKPKPEPRKGDEPQPETTSGDGEKRSGFFGRMFGGKKDAKPVEPAPEPEKKEEKP
ncbi:MAG: hypothetical protein JWO08_2137, partial [Verrucomicrobiaceae bacterium]|nr:hypothetical protein [Verrucomicrobiaceae bacterium]